MQTRVCRLHAAHDLRLETQDIAAPGPGEVLVATGAGGICGSDLHYFLDGGFGPIRVREPMILGHEAAGTVLEIGPGVEGLAPGDRVALDPSQPCGACRFCAEGAERHCLNMRFKGSAMRMPHEQGLFRERQVVPARQCVPMPATVSLTAAACTEPLSVCLHALHRAEGRIGSLAGRRVLVTGAGPIGVLCVALAVRAGAAEVVATDLQDATLAVARAMGATRTVNVAAGPEAMAEWEAEKGQFDLAFECTAAGPAIRTAIACLRPMGTLVQVGVTGDVSLPLNLIVSKEIGLLGTHRFDAEFAEAAALIAAGEIAVERMVTQTFPITRLDEAFATATDRSRSVKVQIAFEAA
jgi:L-idonate 5-dehydrogenase